MYILDEHMDPWGFVGLKGALVGLRALAYTCLPSTAAQWLEAYNAEFFFSFEALNKLITCKACAGSRCQVSGCEAALD